MSEIADLHEYDLHNIVYKQVSRCEVEHPQLAIVYCVCAYIVVVEILTRTASTTVRKEDIPYQIYQVQ